MDEAIGSNEVPGDGCQHQQLRQGEQLLVQGTMEVGTRRGKSNREEGKSHLQPAELYVFPPNIVNA